MTEKTGVIGGLDLPEKAEHSREWVAIILAWNYIITLNRLQLNRYQHIVNINIEAVHRQYALP